MVDQNYMSASEAARRLGVSPVRVRALAEQGRLPARKLANRWVIDANLLVNYRSRVGGRPFSELHAFGLLFVASAEDPTWLSSYEKWRLRRYALPRLMEIVPLLRSRAAVHWLRAPKSAIRRLRGDRSFVKSGLSAAEHYRADISAPAVLDGYYPLREFESFAYRYAATPVPEMAANVVVRAVRHSAILAGREVMPRAVVAVDLADANDSRTRRAGLRMLHDVVR